MAQLLPESKSTDWDNEDEINLLKQILDLLKVGIGLEPSCKESIGSSFDLVSRIAKLLRHEKVGRIAPRYHVQAHLKNGTLSIPYSAAW